jgi:excinuclease ABC subunit A
MKYLRIKGAREHNLKNIDVELPRDKLIVVSGISGSGKSSLAFDTIFAEGQRRYVESLSSYARQFLGRLDKPDVDYIEGLSPAISIEQKTTHRNPRSTVGTVTEIYDYLRLLYARVGHPHCANCGSPIEEQSLDQIVDTIMGLPAGSRVVLLAPVISGKKGEHRKIIADAKRSGFVRIRIDGTIMSLDEEVELEKNKKHSIDIVVDRISIKPEAAKRLAESVETALEVAGGRVTVLISTPEEKQEAERYFSQSSACSNCGTAFPELEPRLFSFNAPQGACPDCSGLGVKMEFDPELIIPNRSLSFNEGGMVPYKPSAVWHRSTFEALAAHYGFSLDTPFAAIPDAIVAALMYGSKDAIQVSYRNEKRGSRYEYQTRHRGVVHDLRRRYLETGSQGVKDWLEQFMREDVCSTCSGSRLRPEALAVTLSSVAANGVRAEQHANIDLVARMSVREAEDFFANLHISEVEEHIARQILKEVRDRLSFMASVGLQYLTLDRRAATLSGGEAQRIRLATQIGSSLVGVLYILDEPTIGLHQRDNQRLIDTLLRLRDLGNTLIVVEHDEQTLRSADYIVDLGPGAGVHGGYITAAGTYEEILASPTSLTGQYLSGELRVERPSQRRLGSGQRLIVRGATEHNLQDVDVEFPLGTFSVITGVSGSGKSTLLADILYPALANRLNRAHRSVGKVSEILGFEHVDKVINIDQSPIGRTPRSNPATYVGLFTPIRELFSTLAEAKARGYKPGRFSFNVKGGRCENCEGDGLIKIEMHFLPDVYITCDVCHGRRYNRETLDIRFKGKNVHDVLDMTVEEAHEFFRVVPAIERKLATLNAVGLGYVRLGQSALTLSGGEAQRVKLSLELAKRSTGRTVYLLDEPTTGLHFDDVRQLLDVLHMLVDQGNTVILIEHNLDVIKQADWLVDLGPEGGDGGGTVVAAGPPDVIAATTGSHTGAYLRAELASVTDAKTLPTPRATPLAKNGARPPKSRAGKPGH